MGVWLLRVLNFKWSSASISENLILAFEIFFLPSTFSFSASWFFVVRTTFEKVVRTGFIFPGSRRFAIQHAPKIHARRTVQNGGWFTVCTYFRIEPASFAIGCLPFIWFARLPWFAHNCPHSWHENPCWTWEFSDFFLAKKSVIVAFLFILWNWVLRNFTGSIFPRGNQPTRTSEEIFL